MSKKNSRTSPVENLYVAPPPPPTLRELRESLAGIQDQKRQQLAGVDTQAKRAKEAITTQFESQLQGMRDQIKEAEEKAFEAMVREVYPECTDPVYFFHATLKLIFDDQMWSLDLTNNHSLLCRLRELMVHQIDEINDAIERAKSVDRLLIHG